MDRIPEQVKELLESVSRYATLDSHVVAEGDEPRITLFTAINKYVISYRIPDGEKPEGYLGCVAASRMPRAGEEWCRGNDLPDGPFSIATWQKILAHIVSYEMVRVCASAR